MKRPAGDLPESRPSKRHMSSSPEEGELDDGTPPTALLASNKSPSTTANAAKLPNKVPFPFKKKVLLPNGNGELSQDDTKSMHGHTRPEDDDKRYRDEDNRRNGQGRLSRADGRSTRPVDHWVPSHDSRGPRPPRRDPYNDRYSDEKPYRSYGEVNNWEPRRSHILVSPRPMRRNRSPSTPRSPSPSSSGSPGKGMHRLPRPSVADVDQKADYDSDHGRDERGRDYKRDRWRNNSPVSSVAGGEGMSFRPRGSWSRREHSVESLRRSEAWDRSRQDTDHYAPTSPRTPPRLPSPQSLHGGPKSPAPPLPDSLPPRPNLEERPTYLPSVHTAVRIALPKKPSTPKEKSPPVSLLAVKESKKQEPEWSSHLTDSTKPGDTVRAATKTRRRQSMKV